MEKALTQSPVGEAQAMIASLFVYPIKSCRGISVSQAPLTTFGFRWDRNWLVVNSKGRGYTQRVEPKLALVEVELPKEAFLEDWEPENNFKMLVIAPGMDTLKVPLTKPQEVADDVSVWEWSGSALDEGEEASHWFTHYLGKPSRLVRFNEESETRPVDPNYAAGQFAKFSDMYPFLLLSQESLDALNSLLKEPVPVNRFRPKYISSFIVFIYISNHHRNFNSNQSNFGPICCFVNRRIQHCSILVSGCEPYAEDLWMEILIKNFTFHGVKLCSRCKVPTINQETGVSGSEPMDTLRNFRSDNFLRPNRKPQGKIYFGQNMVWKNDVCSEKRKIVEVGDPVYVLKKASSAAEAAA